MLAAYRAALPGIALICSTVAFILAMCCLLAGTDPKTLPNMQMYTLNTSRIGPTIQQEMGLSPPDPSFNFSNMLPRDISDKISDAEKSIQSKGGDIVDDAADAIKDPGSAIKNLKSNITETVNDGKRQLESAATKIKSAAKNATGEIVSTFINETIKTLNIQEFYLAHLLTYCSGQYTTGDKHSKENITYCSNHKPNHKPNASTLTNATKDDDPFAFVETLHLPDPVAFAMKAITLLSNIIAAIYIVGIIATFSSLIASGLLIPAALSSASRGSFLRWVNLASSLGAFFSLLLGSALVHFLCKKICGFFEEHAGLGVAAHYGKTFIGCSVAACVFMGIVATVVMMDTCVGHAAGQAKDGVMGVVKKRLHFGRRRMGEKEFDLDEGR